MSVINGLSIHRHIEPVLFLLNTTHMSSLMAISLSPPVPYLSSHYPHRTCPRSTITAHQSSYYPHRTCTHSTITAHLSSHYPPRICSRFTITTHLSSHYPPRTCPRHHGAPVFTVLTTHQFSIHHHGAPVFTLPTTHLYSIHHHGGVSTRTTDLPSHRPHLFTLAVGCRRSALDRMSGTCQLNTATSHRSYRRLDLGNFSLSLSLSLVAE